MYQVQSATLKEQKKERRIFKISEKIFYLVVGFGIAVILLDALVNFKIITIYY